MIAHYRHGIAAAWRDSKMQEKATSCGKLTGIYGEAPRSRYCFQA
jgi:hypothetical protein